MHGKYIELDAMSNTLGVNEHRKNMGDNADVCKICIPYTNITTESRQNDQSYTNCTALETASRWLSMGVATIPIIPGTKSPALDSWRVYQERLPRLAELEAWFGSGRYGLAVVTGWRGLAVIDLDDMWTYSVWLARLNGIAASVLSTYRVRTRAGWHLYFYTDEPARNWCGKVAANGLLIDVRGGGGYVLAPPSVHPSGHQYRGVGDPANIKRVASLGELVPEYTERPEPMPVSPPPNTERDAFDMAMADDWGTASLDEIKAAHPILGYFQDAKPSGGRWYAVRCPFHDDRHASGWVDSGRNLYGCHVCGMRAMDVINFHARLHHLSNREAIAELSKGVL